jgi:beta-propeller repeat-containing protein
MPAGWISIGWIALGSIVAVAVLAAVVVAASSGKSAWHRSDRVKAAVSTKPALSPQTVTAAAHDHVRASYAALPLAFEANEGQADPQVKYVARGSGYRLSLTSKQAIMSLPGRKGTSEVRDMMMNKRRGAAAVKAMLKKRALSAQRESSTAVLRMNLLGADPHTQLIAEDRQQGIVNYFLGNDPSKWRSNIALYGRVSYRNVYPGVDLAFHGAGKQLEFDYLVSPGADAAPIALSFEGAESIRTDGAGDLVLATSAGPVQLHKPIAYQSKNGERYAVDARFVLKGKNHVAFELGSYDHTRELVIDPTVTYSTYFGGNLADYGVSIAVDASGNSYVAGATDSSTIPAAGGTTVSPSNNGSFSGSFDTFVTKIGPTGNCIFTTFFGGTNDDFPGGIAIDSQGIYIAGTTDSADFPATVGQTLFLGGITNGANDAYAVTLALSTGAFTWGTYIAGSDSDSGLGVAVDSGHNIYVVGETYSQNLGGALGGVNPLPSGSAVNLNSGSGADDGYIVKLNSGGTAYSLVSYIGGSNGDLATGVALDGSGNIYVAGTTISTDLPVTSPVVQSQCGTDGTCNAGATGAVDDAFVVSIKANLSGYNYVTYYGGSGVDEALAIAADASGNAFFTGTTSSSDFPTSGTPFQTALLGTTNAYLVELNSSGSAATYGTYFGGDGSDFGLSVALDVSDNVYLTGQTTSSSASFPLLNPTQAVGSGNSDAFVSVLGLSQGQLLFSTFLGGGGDEDQFEGAIGLDSSENIYVAGDTDSGNGTTAVFPTTAGPIDGTYGGGTCLKPGGGSIPCTDAFVTAYGPATTADFTVSATTPAAVSPGTSGTSTVTLTSLNGYGLAVNLTCSVTGSGTPAPACSASSFSPNPQTPTAGGATSTLTVTTTGKTAALYRPSSIYYAMWLPILGLSLVGMRFSSTESRRKRLLGFLLLGVVMATLFFLPACSSSGGGGGGGCTGCTAAGNYTVTVTGTDANNLSHSTQVTLTVN